MYTDRLSSHGSMGSTCSMWYFRCFSTSLHTCSFSHNKVWLFLQFRRTNSSAWNHESPTSIIITLKQSPYCWLNIEQTLARIARKLNYRGAPNHHLSWFLLTSICNSSSTQAWWPCQPSKSWVPNSPTLHRYAFSRCSSVNASYQTQMGRRKNTRELGINEQYSLNARALNAYQIHFRMLLYGRSRGRIQQHCIFWMRKFLDGKQCRY